MHLYATPFIDLAAVEAQMERAVAIYAPVGIVPRFRLTRDVRLDLDGDGTNALVGLSLAARWPWHSGFARFRAVRRWMRDTTRGQRSVVFYLFGLERRAGDPEIAITGGPTGSMRVSWISAFGSRAPYKRTLAHELGHQWGQRYHSLGPDNLMSAAARADGTLSERLSSTQARLRFTAVPRGPEDDGVA